MQLLLQTPVWWEMVISTQDEEVVVWLGIGRVDVVVEKTVEIPTSRGVVETLDRIKQILPMRCLGLKDLILYETEHTDPLSIYLKHMAL